MQIQKKIQSLKQRIAGQFGRLRTNKTPMAADGWMIIPGPCNGQNYQSIRYVLHDASGFHPC